MKPPGAGPEVRFVKAPAGAASDTLVCRREDGTVLEIPMAREAVLTRLLVQWVVESTGAFAGGWFAGIAGGLTPLAAARRTVARQAAVVARLLQAEQWSGASAPQDFVPKVAAACRRERVRPPQITVEDVARWREALRTVGAAWRPLAAGRALTYPLNGS